MRGGLFVVGKNIQFSQFSFLLFYALIHIFTPACRAIILLQQNHAHFVLDPFKNLLLLRSVTFLIGEQYFNFAFINYKEKHAMLI